MPGPASWYVLYSFFLVGVIKRTSIDTWSKFEIGGAIALAVQAGMEKPNPSTFMDIGAKAYYFIIGWTVVLSGVYVVFYKQPKALDVEHKETMTRIMQRKGDTGV